MIIDLDRCTGCKACEVACMAENNLPISDERAIQDGEEVKWIRVERYIYGEYPDVSIQFLPLLCQQCEEAPCEPVCPVYATYHSQEAGHLNVQVYNRCVGVRYCANNCPYNARTFNWKQPEWPEPLTWQLNPDITTRDRGVMEKCTFCIQRIDRAQDKAQDARRPVRDGDIAPACAQACPAEAMVFGDLNDKDSLISKLAKSERSFQVYEHLGTKPKVIYLKKREEQESLAKALKGTPKEPR